MVLANTIPRSTWIGFDRLFDELDRVSHINEQGFPRHNIVKTSELEFRIELAVAGVSEDDVSIVVKDNKLVIEGQARKDDETVDYVHRGITSKSFTRQFRLAEHTVVDGADLSNGILTVYLRIDIPEEKKPREIKLGTKPKQLLTE